MTELKAITNAPSYITALPSAFPWIAVGLLFAAILRSAFPWRQMSSTERAGEVARLTERVISLEGKLDRQEARHEAQLTLLRHQLANERQATDAFLMLLKATPDKVDEVIRIVSEMREKNQRLAAVENATLNAATIVAASLHDEK